MICIVRIILRREITKFRGKLILYVRFCEVESFTLTRVILGFCATEQIDLGREETR